MIGTSLMQPLQRLVYDFHLRLCSGRCQQFHHLGGDFLVSERCIDILHIVHHLLLRQPYLVFRFAVGSGNHIFHIPVFQQFDGRFESNEFTHLCHVDAIIIRITYLRGRRNNHNLLGAQTVENTDNTLFQSGSAHNGVVDNDKIVHTRHQTAIGDIIHMRSQVIAAVSFCNKRAQFDILDGYLLTTDTAGKYLLQFLQIRAMSQGSNLLHFLFIQIIIQSLQHAVESNFRCIRDEGKHSMIKVFIDGFQDVRYQFLTQ